MFSAILLLAALSACRTAPLAPTPQPELQLLGAAPLTLADDCSASGSFIVEFTVERSGRTGAIEPPQAPECVRQALTTWVASFRYAPPVSATPNSIEWLMTTAKRGT